MYNSYRYLPVGGSEGGRSLIGYSRIGARVWEYQQASKVQICNSVYARIVCVCMCDFSLGKFRVLFKYHEDFLSLLIIISKGQKELEVLPTEIPFSFLTQREPKRA